MDFDLEIINEEGDRPDPLFDSIMSAMNSMKEATADKIYQKIQKEGATNYSKPQVDRALASALKYGIFEVRNNRYRVRDDILDDEDTVYWKLPKKREQTPYRLQEDFSEKHGPKLDPEKDNQRFQKPVSKDFEECPNCGRSNKQNPTPKKSGSPKNSKKKKQKKQKGEPRNSRQEQDSKQKRGKRKRKESSQNEGRSSKRRKANDSIEQKNQNVLSNKYFNEEKFLSDLKKEEAGSQDEGFDTSDSEMDLLNGSEHNLRNYPEKKKNNHPKCNRTPRSAFSSECVKAELDILKIQRSSISVKSESDSEKIFISSASDDESPTRDEFAEENPCTSKNLNDQLQNPCLSSIETYSNTCEKDSTKKSTGDSWLGYSDEPQGAIIQSNNVLTIEPMDLLAFKSPEQATYIS